MFVLSSETVSVAAKQKPNLIPSISNSILFDRQTFSRESVKPKGGVHENVRTVRQNTGRDRSRRDVGSDGHHSVGGHRRHAGVATGRSAVSGGIGRRTGSGVSREWARGEHATSN